MSTPGGDGARPGGGAQPRAAAPAGPTSGALGGGARGAAGEGVSGAGASDDLGIVGRYVLLRRLDRSGFSDLYLGVTGDPSDYRAAIVHMQPAPADSRRGFLDRIAALRALAHPHIVRVLEADVEAGRRWVAFEPVEGRDLGALAGACEQDRRDVPVDAVAVAARAVCRALVHLHGAGMRHGDVRPGNVLLGWDGHVRLADLALRAGPAAGAAAAAADVCGVGAMVWEVLTGEPLLGATGPIQLGTGRPAVLPPSHLWARMPADLDAIVECAIHPDPARAWPSARAMLDALDGYLARHAPAAGADLIASLLAELFGDAADRDRRERDRLVRAVFAAVPLPEEVTGSVVAVESSEPAAVTPEEEAPAAAPPPAAAAAPAGADAVPVQGVADRLWARARQAARRERPDLGLPRVREAAPVPSVGGHLLLGRADSPVWDDLYLAVTGDPQRPQHRIVKLLAGEIGAGAATAFRERAAAARALAHPQLLPPADAGVQDGRRWAAFDVVEGQDLHAALDRWEQRRGGPFPLDVAALVGRDLARALAHLHGAGLCHGQVAPANVLLGYDGGVRLGDYGLSISRAASGEPGVASDVCAVGALLWQLLTGAPLWEATGSVQMATGRPAVLPPSHLWARMPAEMDAIVERAIHPDAARCWEDARALLAALDGYLARNAPRTDRRRIASLLRELFGDRAPAERAERRRLASVVLKLAPLPEEVTQAVLEADIVSEDAAPDLPRPAERIDLGELLARRNRLPLALARSIAAQCCTGLLRMRGEGRPVRVLQPEGVRVELAAGGTVQVALIPDAESSAGRRVAPVAADAYRAPELDTGADPDVLTDAFAVGAVLYEMLAGRAWIPGSPALRKLRPDVPRELEELARRATLVDRTGRPVLSEMVRVLSGEEAIPEAEAVPTGDLDRPGTIALDVSDPDADSIPEPMRDEPGTTRALRLRGDPAARARGGRLSGALSAVTSVLSGRTRITGPLGRRTRPHDQPQPPSRAAVLARRALAAALLAVAVWLSLVLREAAAPDPPGTVRVEAVWRVR